MAGLPACRLKSRPGMLTNLGSVLVALPPTGFVSSRGGAPFPHQRFRSNVMALPSPLLFQYVVALLALSPATMLCLNVVVPLVSASSLVTGAADDIPPL